MKITDITVTSTKIGYYSDYEFTLQSKREDTFSKMPYLEVLVTLPDIFNEVLDVIAISDLYCTVSYYTAASTLISQSSDCTLMNSSLVFKDMNLTSSDFDTDELQI